MEAIGIALFIGMLVFIVLAVKFGLTLVASAVWLWFSYRGHSSELSYDLLIREAYVPLDVRSGAVLAYVGGLMLIVGLPVLLVGYLTEIDAIYAIGIVLVCPALLGCMFFCFFFLPAMQVFGGPDAAKKIIERKCRTCQDAIEKLTAMITEGDSPTVLGLYRRYWRACNQYELIMILGQSLPKEPLNQNLLDAIQGDLGFVESHAVLQTPLRKKLEKLKRELYCLMHSHELEEIVASRNSRAWVRNNRR